MSILYLKGPDGNKKTLIHEVNTNEVILSPLSSEELVTVFFNSKTEKQPIVIYRDEYKRLYEALDADH